MENSSATTNTSSSLVHPNWPRNTHREDDLISHELAINGLATWYLQGLGKYLAPRDSTFGETVWIEPTFQGPDRIPAMERCAPVVRAIQLYKNPLCATIYDSAS